MLERMLAVNLGAAFRCAGALPSMTRQDGGRISISQHRWFARLSLRDGLCPAKHALVGFTARACHGNAPQGHTVNASVRIYGYRTGAQLRRDDCRTRPGAAKASTPRLIRHNRSAPDPPEKSPIGRLALWSGRGFPSRPAILVAAERSCEGTADDHTSIFAKAFPVVVKDKVGTISLRGRTKKPLTFDSYPECAYLRALFHSSSAKAMFYGGREISVPAADRHDIRPADEDGRRRLMNSRRMTGDC